VTVVELGNSLMDLRDHLINHSYGTRTNTGST